MDVRCEKCQTEYELDEARLKPGGVTVKCTHCGHMFKIRKRTTTNVGTPVSAERHAASTPPPPRADSVFDEAPTERVSGPAERQWLIRLENGEQKSCRELATLQQWIIAGVVTRESLISRTGKTWKRLGDIAELAQYYDIADEARTTREARPTGRSSPGPTPSATPSGTMLGMSPAAAGGTIVRDDEPARAPLPRVPGVVPRIVEKTPPLGTIGAPRRPGASAPPATKPSAPPRPAAPSAPVAPIELAPPPVVVPPMPSAPVPSVTPVPPSPSAPTVLGKRPITQPPPIPKRATGPASAISGTPRPPVKQDDARSTANWAHDPMKPAVQQSSPFVGKLSAIPDEPAFAAGRVRPLDPEADFSTGKVSLIDEDDDLLPRRRGSRAGLWIVLGLLAVGGVAVGGIYLVMNKEEPAKVAKAPEVPVAAPPADAAVVAEVDASVPPPAASPVDVARAELLGDSEAKLRTAFESLAGKDAPADLVVRAHLGAGLAQALLDRAGLVADRAEADKLRKDAKALAVVTATEAQRALKAVPSDPSANGAMAAALRLQGKPAAAIKRYSDAAKAAPPADGGIAWVIGWWQRDALLADALLLARDGKLDEARAAFAEIEKARAGDLQELAADVRARFQLARIALAQGKSADAKPLVEEVLAAQPEHAGALALKAKLEATVAKTDPLPPEEGGATPVPSGGTGGGPTAGAGTRPPATGGGGARPPASGGGGGGEPPAGLSYDGLLARANKLADTNCAAAMPHYAKALEQKPNGVEALTGMGYCHIDAKQFSSAFGKFRAAMAIAPRYEPAVWGIAEAYQQQGLKDQAIEAYQRYLEVFPGSAKAQRQIERLGGGGAPPPPAPPPPAPTPTPTPDPAAGSGSG